MWLSWHIAYIILSHRFIISVKRCKYWPLLMSVQEAEGERKGADVADRVAAEDPDYKPEAE